MSSASFDRSRPVVGIFVGGASRRMGGMPKGLLAAPDGSGSLAARLADLARAEGLEVVLVGAHPAYAALGLPVVADAVSGAGPLGGLVALLEHAGDRSVLALACDMPFLDRTLLRRLANEELDAAILAPRRASRWEPLAARYAPGPVLPIARARLSAGELGLQGLCDAVGARTLALASDDADELDDWDSPEDVAR